MTSLPARPWGRGPAALGLLGWSLPSSRLQALALSCLPSGGAGCAGGRECQAPLAMPVLQAHRLVSCRRELLPATPAVLLQEPSAFGFLCPGSGWDSSVPGTTPCSVRALPACRGCLCTEPWRRAAPAPPQDRAPCYVSPRDTSGPPCRRGCWEKPMPWSSPSPLFRGPEGSQPQGQTRPRSERFRSTPRCLDGHSLPPAPAPPRAVPRQEEAARA